MKGRQELMERRGEERRVKGRKEGRERAMEKSYRGKKEKKN